MQTATEPVTGCPNPVLSSADLSLSAVSWPAIAAGTAVAAAASILLATLGAGAGFGAISPWPHARPSAGTFTAMMAVGLIVVQWASAGIGGYVTGRLRTKWTGLHTYEVFFRDTAHGLITWATATLLATAAAAGVAASAAGATGHAIATGVAEAKMASPTPTIDPYDVDTLLRPTGADTQPFANEAVSNEMRMQTAGILAAGLIKGDMPSADRLYLTQVVAAQARVSPTDAQARVDAIAAKLQADHEQARRATEDARKAAQAASMFTALAMLVGAFIACIAAALGGHRRDAHA